MLTRTCEEGIQALICVARRPTPTPVPPRAIAAELKVSETYLAKILHLLVRAGILQSHRGARGGVSLARDPATVHLLEVVQAIQGVIRRNHCDLADPRIRVCGFHRAMREMHDAVVDVLSRWTLAQIAFAPCEARRDAACHMRRAGRSGAARGGSS
jgi:Rrf2 family protein